MLKIIYDYYLNENKLCEEFSVEEPSDEFQSLMDLIEIKLIKQAGNFSSLNQILKSGKRTAHKQYINSLNFDKLCLDQEEIQSFQRRLKLTKTRIIRCFELMILAKLDPNDHQVHLRFG